MFEDNLLCSHGQKWAKKHIQLCLVLLKVSRFQKHITLSSHIQKNQTLQNQLDFSHFLSARKRQLALLVIVFLSCLSPLKPKYLLISIICVMTHHVKDSNSNSKHIKYKRPKCSKEFPKNSQK